MKPIVRQPLARVSFMALSLMLATALSGCGGSSSKDSSAAGTSPAGGSAAGSQKTPTTTDPVTLRIAYNPNPTNTTIVVADQQGFFKAHGLSVKLTSTQSSAALLPSLGKQYDLITVTQATLLQSAAQGQKPILVSAQTVENATTLRNSFLVGGKGISSIADLKGKKIGVPGLSGGLYEGAVIALNKAGLQKTDVRFLQVPFADMAAGLKSGTINAAATIFPFQGQMLGQGGKDLGSPTLLSTGTQMSAGWVASDAWAKANGPTIAAFNKAQDEALTWMKANEAASRQILVKDFQLPEFVAKTFPVTQFFSFQAKPEYLEPWIAPMKQVGDLPKSFDTPAKDLVYAP